MDKMHSTCRVKLWSILPFNKDMNANNQLKIQPFHLQRSNYKLSKILFNKIHLPNLIKSNSILLP